MAVKTRFSPQVFQQILAQYDLGTFNRCQPIPAGTVQTTYFIYTSGGKFVFRYYENRSVPAVTFESEMLQYLIKHHYPCPAPLPDKQVRTVHSYQGKPFMMMTFLPGQPVEDPSDYHKGQLIQYAAWLQNLTGLLILALTPIGLSIPTFRDAEDLLPDYEAAITQG